MEVWVWTPHLQGSTGARSSAQRTGRGSRLSTGRILMWPREVGVLVGTGPLVCNQACVWFYRIFDIFRFVWLTRCREFNPTFIFGYLSTAIKNIFSFVPESKEYSETASLVFCCAVFEGAHRGWPGCGQSAYNGRPCLTNFGFFVPSPFFL